MRVPRRKLKITIVNPAKGKWGMHDGWGSWPEHKYYRVLGVLFCKKHLTIPKKEYSSFSNCYYFICEKCDNEQRYNERREWVLLERKKGRHQRLKEYDARQRHNLNMLSAIKELYK